MSRGINHGTISHHIALLDKQRLAREIGWSGSSGESTEQLRREAHVNRCRSDSDEEVWDNSITPPNDIDAATNGRPFEHESALMTIREMLACVKDMAFCGNHFLLALGDYGVWGTDLSTAYRSKATQPSSDRSSEYSPVALATVSSAQGLVRSTQGPPGIYVSG
jgi:hypothetical protein